MKDEKGNNAYAYISIVAIVAIVAVFVMFAGSGSKETPQPVVLTSGFAGDIVGDARSVGSINFGSCPTQNITWSEQINSTHGNFSVGIVYDCAGYVSAANNGQGATVNNLMFGTTGRARVVCSNGQWIIHQSTCNPEFDIIINP